MAKSQVSGCGCIGIGIVAVMILGPLLDILEKAGWFLAVLAVVGIAVAIYFKSTSKKEKAAQLEKFAYGPAREAEFIVFDTETSGLYPEEGAQIVQIALLAMDSELNELGRFTTVVNPHGDVGKSDLHGVTKSRAFFAPDFRDISKNLHATLAGKALVAHNSDFDEKFIRMEFSRVGMDLPDAQFIDTLGLARRHIKGVLNYKLITLVDQLGIEVSDAPSGGAHDAMYDALCCAELLKEICLRAEIDPASLKKRK